MEQAASTSFPHRVRNVIWIGLLFVTILGGGLLLQCCLLRQAGRLEFQRQGARNADLLSSQIVTPPTSGAARSLGVSNVRIKAVINGTLPEDYPSLLSSLTGLKNKLKSDLIFVMNAEGHVVISTPYDGGKSITGSNFAFRSYFRRALAGHTVVYPALGSMTFQRGLYYAAPVYAEHQTPDAEDQVIGVIVIKMPFSMIDELLQKTSDITTLISPLGIVFTSSIAEWLFLSVPEQRHLSTGMEQASEHPEYDSDFFRKRSLPLALQFHLNGARWKGVNYAVQTFSIPLDDPAGDWTLLLLRNPSSWFPIGQILLNALALLALCLAIIIALYVQGRNRLARAAKINQESEAAQTYRSIFNSVTDALFVHHAQSGKILEANESAKILYDYTDSDLETLSPEGDFPYPGAIALPALKAALENRTQIITFQALSKAGQAFWAQATFRVYTIHGVDRILANVHDITEGRTAHIALTTSKKELEREVEVRTGQLLQAEKMAAIGKFAERVTHDVTNGMTRIIGYADIARHRPDNPALLDASLKEISTAAHDMCELATELLSFSHPSPLKLSPMNLCRVVEGFEKFIRASAPPAVQIEFKIPKIRLMVNLSPNHIEQVLAHLALNSFESIGNAKGTLTISVRRGERGENVPTVGDVRISSEKLALLEVTDSGAGFAPEHLSHVFDPFFTTKMDSKRRGIGLTTVYIIVNSHDGQINILSGADGGGGNVQIWLPLIDDAHSP